MQVWNTRVCKWFLGELSLYKKKTLQKVVFHHEVNLNSAIMKHLHYRSKVWGQRLFFLNGCLRACVCVWVCVYVYCQQWQRGMRQQMEKPLKYSWKSLEELHVLVSHQYMDILTCTLNIYFICLCSWIFFLRVCVLFQGQFYTHLLVVGFIFDLVRQKIGKYL